ncbi:elongation factor P hydroxylase [Reinekea marina]|uniref:Elongation factor P hydroxylase n=1 Tax=Reinekea marina TaxID=1310421 RepID=A0ABV7WRN3_9GAMM
MSSVELHTLPTEKWESGVEQLLACLNPWLESNWQTTLVAAPEEPFYKPASLKGSYHQIQFAHGYFSSALHELAHWCVAGENRRLLPDYGYWYEPDGRTAEQQKLFEQVEVKPQAIEWHFTQACQRTFNVSADNLTGEATDISRFQKSVTMQMRYYEQHGLPKRASSIKQRLQAAFQSP